MVSRMVLSEVAEPLPAKALVVIAACLGVASFRTLLPAVYTE
jgi:hypothetical protein